LDGKADVAFWGRDAEALARETAAPLHGGEFGWRDLPLEEARSQLHALYEASAQHAVAIDYRPHSHHYHVMEQIRSTENMSGVLDIGGARLCAFHTGCGDGYFPVIRDLDGEGRLVRVRIDLHVA
jgi:hypothetical protein